MNWNGQPLSFYEIVMNLIDSTTNELGLRVKYVLYKWKYELGIMVSNEDFATIKIKIEFIS